MKLDFNMDKSRVLHRKGSQAAKRHVLQTWAMPEVRSNTVNDWNIFTKISMSMSSHLLLTVPHSSISRNSIASQQRKNLQKPKKQKGNREKPQEFKINPKNRIFSTPKTQRTHNSSTKDQLEKIWIAPHVHLQWSCPDHNTPNIISRLIIYDPKWIWVLQKHKRE